MIVKAYGVVIGFRMVVDVSRDRAEWYFSTALFSRDGSSAEY
jgi:hypothetical protein